VKHWHETAEILGRVKDLAGGGVRAAIATVVRISGSAYRRPGAKFLVAEDGSTAGGVSGGCLEADVRALALDVARDGAPRLLHYDTGSDEETLWGLGLGCEGAVDVFVQPASGELVSGPAARILESIAAAAPFAVCTVVEGDGAGRSLVLAGGKLSGATGSPELDRAAAERAARLLETGDSQLDQVDGRQVFTDVLRPPPALVIFGAGDDARPLAALAAQAGFEVTVVDHRRAFLTAERFPPPARLLLRRAEDGLDGLTFSRRHFAVVQTHALQHDRDWLRALLAQPLAYLGLLGPRARKDQILRQLGTPEPERLFAPVGLDLAADGPEQVAVSIVAEMLAVNAGREPSHLRSKRGGIHDG
jgi:xanthine/CO dehydrogenase XdhC/CoxF family maturation factor